MAEKFTVEIITPEQTILKSDATEVIIPSYEGLMGILKDHVPLITFLRPGILLVKNQDEKKYYIEEGTVEFYNNKLLILTTNVKNLRDLNKDDINNLLQEAEKEIKTDETTDKERYLISYKINTLKEINQ